MKAIAANASTRDKIAPYYAIFLNAGARSYVEKGDLQRADSALNSNEKAIISMLNSRHEVYAEHLLIRAYWYEYSRNEKEAEKAFSKALSTASSYKKSDDKSAMPYHAELIEYYVRSDNKRKATNEAAKFEKVTKKSFKKSSTHRLLAMAMEAHTLIMDDKKKKAEKNATYLALNNPHLPAKHDVIIKGSKILTNLYLEQRKYEQAYSWLTLTNENIAALRGRMGSWFHLAEIHRKAHLLDYAYDIGETKEIALSSFDSFLRQEINQGHPEYIFIHSTLSEYYALFDEYEKALETMDNASEATRIIPHNGEAYARQVVKHADLLYMVGDIEKSLNFLNGAERILSPVQTKPENVAAFSSIMYQRSRLLTIQGDPDASQKILNTAGKYLKRRKASNVIDNATASALLAEVYETTGQHSEAERLLNESINLIENEYGHKRKSIEKHLKLGQLKITQGDYAAAANIAQEAAMIISSIYGENSTKFADCLILKADVSAALGDFSTSIDNLQKSLKIYHHHLGSEHLHIAVISSKLAMVMHNDGKNLEAIDNYLSQSMTITEKHLGTENSFYASLLSYAAISDIKKSNFKLAFEKLTRAETIWSKTAGRKNNANAARVNVLMGDLYYQQKDYSKARQYYQKSIKLYEKFFNESHPDYVKVLAKISRVEYMNGKEKVAIDYIENVMEKYDAYIAQFFPVLSEREKVRFWNLIKDDYEYYNSVILKTIKNSDDKKIGKLYNNAINTKALLLNSSVRLRQSILSSGDEILIGNFMEWQSGKELLARVLTLSPEELNQMSINKDSLMQSVEKLERQLSSSSGLFSELSQKKNVSWENIKSALKSNEVAIEMVRYRHFDHVLTDSIIYAAFVLRNEKRRNAPEVVLFENGRELENKYFKYYKNMIVYRMEDELSYDRFWKPIEEKTGKTDAIFLSPDGIFSQINLETIPYPDGRYVADNFSIFLVSNTKDILQQKTVVPGASISKGALLYGDPQFYASTGPAINPTIITRLPGTRDEVLGIAQVFETNGWQTNYYLENDTDEHILKTLEMPNVFHIATHGFYAPAKAADGFSMEALDDNHTQQNPLLRSGLMLKGAGDILAHTNYNFNMDDGILTAYEAMNLNLSNTDMVVLSACETGVGDVSAGEGVYGLQRAFMVAGAKTLIMSLFKVNDAITSELMVNFYSQWIQTGNTRKAFKEAQNAIRAKNPEPIFWGSFIMFGIH